MKEYLAVASIGIIVGNLGFAVSFSNFTSILISVLVCLIGFQLVNSQKNPIKQKDTKIPPTLISKHLELSHESSHSYTPPDTPPSPKSCEDKSTSLEVQGHDIGIGCIIESSDNFSQYEILPRNISTQTTIPMKDQEVLTSIPQSEKSTQHEVSFSEFEMQTDQYIPSPVKPPEDEIEQFSPTESGFPPYNPVDYIHSEEEEEKIEAQEEAFIPEPSLDSKKKPSLPSLRLQPPEALDNSYRYRRSLSLGNDFSVREDSLSSERTETLIGNMIHLNPISLIERKLFSTAHLTSGIQSFINKPIVGLFISPSKIEYLEIFGEALNNAENLDLFPVVPPMENELEDADLLSAWLLGSYLCDYIIIFIDLENSHNLIRESQFAKYLSLIRDIDKPLFIFHKTSSKIPYQISFQTINDILEEIYQSDRVLLHEEITHDLHTNAETLMRLREQMSDNLAVPDTWNIKEWYKDAFDKTISSLFIITNSRKAELLLNCEVNLSEDSLSASVDIALNWSCSVRPKFSEICPKNILNYTPAHYIIDDKIVSEISYQSSSEIPTNIVKVAILSNRSTKAFNIGYLHTINQFVKDYNSKVGIMLETHYNKDYSSSNHINTELFDTLWNNIFISQLGDIVILSIFYENDKIVIPPDGFLALELVIRNLLKNRETKKPLMIIYHRDHASEASRQNVFFLKAIEEMNDYIKQWAHLPARPELTIFTESNQGFYAFDKENQIIHRLVCKSQPIGWQIYNSILFKLMYESVSRSIELLSFKHQSISAFKVALSSLLTFTDEERVLPSVLYNSYDEPGNNWSSSRKLYKFEIHAPIQPSWIIEHSRLISSNIR